MESSRYKVCLLHPFYSPLQFLVSLSRQFIAYKVYGFIFFFFSLNIPFGGGWRRSPHSYGIVGLILCYTHRECTQMGSRSAGPSPSALGSRLSRRAALGGAGRSLSGTQALPLFFFDHFLTHVSGSCLSSQSA